jgi:hypothetical protein
MFQNAVECRAFVPHWLFIRLHVFAGTELTKILARAGTIPCKQFQFDPSEGIAGHADVEKYHGMTPLERVHDGRVGTRHNQGGGTGGVCRRHLSNRKGLVSVYWNRKDRMKK